MTDSRNDNGGAPQTIEPVRFRPTAATPRQRRRIVTPRQALLLAAGVAAGWFLWFIFTAKSVRFEVQPEAESLSVDGGFAFRLGEVYLLREGGYRVRAQAVGYHDIVRRVQVGAERNQVVPLRMLPLPGRVTFEIVPPGATVRVRGEASGQAPFEAKIAAGEHVAELSHERYQPATLRFLVAGRDQAQTVSAALAPNWAEIAIPTDPSGAQVWVDGADTGVLTPGPAAILAGERRVSIRLAGHKPWTDILHVEAGKPQQLPRVALERTDARVDVQSTPAGASITVDGDYRGVTPLSMDVAPGNREVRAFKVGYGTKTRSLQARSGGRHDLAFALVALQGTLAIETDPDDAELWINGEHRGRASGTRSVRAVPLDIEIKKPGHADYRKTVVPQPGFTLDLKVRLLTLQEARLEALKQVRTTSAGHELVLLSPGSIRMGASRREPGRRANEVLRTANLSRLFYLGRHEVTNAQFRAFAKGHSSGQLQNNVDLDGERQPAVGVSWTEAALYCNWLSRQDGLQPFYLDEYGKIAGFDPKALGYRLPTEAEWAWAARHDEAADQPKRFAWGDRLPPPERHGNYADRSAAHLVARIILGYNDNHIGSAPVGTFPANAKGIFDLGGNVAEWTHDYYDIPDGSETTDPLGPSEGQYHVIRGASWQKGTVTDLRLSFRDYGSEGRQDLGFRIARFAE